MVAYNAKWGGGASAVWINDIKHYCSLMNVPAYVHVPGRVFAALAKLDFDTEMPARAVTAILKRVAVSSRIVDGVASDVKVNDISAIGSKKDKIALFLEANMIMENCANILKEKKIIDPQKTLDEGWLQINLIDCVMGKANSEGMTWPNLEAVTQEFIKRLFSDDVEDLQVAAASTVVPSSNVVQYTEQGEAVDVPKMVLLGKGFKVGSKYTRKMVEDTNNTAAPSDHTIYKLLDIEGDGTCTLQAYSDFGELVGELEKVGGANLAARYKPFEKDFKFLEDYTGTEIKYNEAYQNDVCMHRVKDCLLTLALEMNDFDLTTRISPSKGVFCKGDISTDAMLLCPYGNVVKYDPTVKKVKIPDQRNCLKLESPSGDTSVFILSGMATDSKTQNAYWAIQGSHDKAKCNMKFVDREVRFIIPSTGKLQIAGRTFILKVPCLQNLKPIKKGSELIFFKEKLEQDKPIAKDKPLKLDMTAAKKSRKS